MKLKILSIVIIISICLFFVYEKISSKTIGVTNTNIEDLEILKYLPRDNKLLFISNYQSSDIVNNIRKKFTIKNQAKLNLFKNSILTYLGIDLGENKLADIYNNELTISTYESNKKNIDDTLIVFKIKKNKDLNDLLNITNIVNETDKVVKIYRENKLNYLNYIYLTHDNYILASSDKKLIIESIASSKDNKITNNYYNEIKNNFKNQNNILFTKNLENNFLLNNENFHKGNADLIATEFTLKDKNLVCKSYLINNKKNLDTASYKKLIKESEINQDNYQISIFNDLNNSMDYIIGLSSDNIEKSFLQELNLKLKQESLLLIFNNNWIITFQNNNENKKSINKIEILKNFNKNSIKRNNNIYSIYSKDILEQEENDIKQVTYGNIFSAESDELILFSNNLINEENISLLTNKFLNLNGHSDSRKFLYKTLYVKGSLTKKAPFSSYLDNINNFLQNSINLSDLEFRETIEQTIPENNPIIYTETSLKIS